MMRYGLFNLVARRKTVLWELLPSEPVDYFRLEAWWIVCPACATLELALDAARVWSVSACAPRAPLLLGSDVASVPASCMPSGPLW